MMPCFNTRYFADLSGVKSSYDTGFKSKLLTQKLIVFLVISDSTKAF